MEDTFVTEKSPAVHVFGQRHGSPYDRGSADRFYGRPYNPHYLVGPNSKIITIKDMTREEITEYMNGWNEEWDRKEWR